MEVVAVFECVEDDEQLLGIFTSPILADKFIADRKTKTPHLYENLSALFSYYTSTYILDDGSAYTL